MVNILTIKGFDDNYFWLIKEKRSGRCIIVDPGDANPVLEMLKSQNITLDAILLTHHHHDHIGGVNELLETAENIKVFSKNKLFENTNQVKDGDVLTFFDGQYSLTVMETPGHTLDHLVFYNKEVAFCGDLLFSAGCGRIFEGTAEQMFASLLRVAMLDSDINIYCAHEYTQNNLSFAHHLEPKNSDLLVYIEQVSKKRQQGLPTIPTTIGLEKKINPFLRCEKKSLINALEYQLNMLLATPIDCFRELRLYKDRF
ncbi:MAG: hydroxyacylglutathione hydrolase [Psychromonas sp.]|nr:hydroxyacylglutathione hydrolase [Psychromonas sp.]